MHRLQRETLISARTVVSPATTTAVGTFVNVGSIAMANATSMLLFLDVTTAFSGGTSPTLDLYVQRAIKPDPASGTDADWEDLYAFPQITTGTTPQHVVVMPHRGSATTVTLAAGSHTRSQAALGADNLHDGHWGDVIRIVEKGGGTIDTAAIYSLHATAYEGGAVT